MDMEKNYWSKLHEVEKELMAQDWSSEEKAFLVQRACYYIERLRVLHEGGLSMHSFIEKCMSVLEKGYIFRVEGGSLWMAGEYYLEGGVVSIEVARQALVDWYDTHPEELAMDRDYIEGVLV